MFDNPLGPFVNAYSKCIKIRIGKSMKMYSCNSSVDTIFEGNLDKREFAAH